MLCLVPSPAPHKHGVAHRSSVPGPAICRKAAIGSPSARHGFPVGSWPSAWSWRAGSCRRPGLWLPGNIATDSRSDLGSALPSLGPRWPVRQRGPVGLCLKVQMAGPTLPHQVRILACGGPGVKVSRWFRAVAHWRPSSWLLFFRKRPEAHLTGKSSSFASTLP